jgi:hypothetical protein
MDLLQNPKGTSLFLFNERDHLKERLFLLWPPLLISLFVILGNLLDLNPKKITPITWLMAVVFIDVAHVWSTLFRTYLSRKALSKWKKELMLTPLFCYLGGVLIYSFGSQYFWRILAYFAVFHFIRQQYGLYRLYDLKEAKGKKMVLFDKVIIYSCTLIPVVIWHLNGPQDFYWFVPQDFWYFPQPQLASFLKGLGPLLFIFYFLKETRRIEGLPTRPKHLIVLGTFLAWWTGIVWLPNDWSFTLTNVVAHGLPYFALIGLKHFNDQELQEKDQVLPLPKNSPFLGAIFLVLLLGFFEEVLWDIFFWRDHEVFFGFFYTEVPIEDFSLKTLLVPLFALPQATHYALDGFIWKTDR